ncbi:MAG: HEAT repeat domain-containing protein [Actinomycetes bacterium]
MATKKASEISEEASLRNRLPVSGRTISWVQERAYSTLSEPLRAVLGTLELQPGYRIVIPETPGKVPIKRGSKGMDTHKAWDLASNPSATAEELALAATAPSHSHVEYVWDEQAPDVPGQIRASGVTWEVGGDSVTRFPQILVALHPNTSADTLILLRKARSKHVRAALAQRPDLHALPILVRDKDPLVRRAVAEQEACPVELLAVLSLDPDIAVRSAASVHPQATDEIRAQAAILGIK